VNLNNGNAVFVRQEMKHYEFWKEARLNGTYPWD
jgi:hypothetical protein